MKTIGMLGGMSWASTASYYKAINQAIKAELGGLHSAKLCLYSVDFAELEQLQHRGQWDEIALILADAAVSVEAGGADFLMICTNTMHKVFAEIEAHISIPILHIADATAIQLMADSLTKVGLLGTRFTMQQDFYKNRLADKFALEVVVPDSEDQTRVDNIIYHELCREMIVPESREQYLRIINTLHQQGAEAVILGCTEIALLIQQEHTQVPLYDTTKIHAAQAVQMAIADH